VKKGRGDAKTALNKFPSVRVTEIGERGADWEIISLEQAAGLCNMDGEVLLDTCWVSLCVIFQAAVCYFFSLVGHSPR
jgi:hypothetical protein